MTNLIKSHSFILHKANGKDDFRIQLRAAHWHIKSEKALLETMDKSITIWETKNPPLGKSLREKFNRRDLLDIMRFWGILAGSERLTKNER